jgi:DNA end-binding protein Ku
MSPSNPGQFTLASTGKVGVTKVALRTGSRESLALLRAHGDVLVLHTMRWPDEIRPATGVPPPQQASPKSPTRGIWRSG